MQGLNSIKVLSANCQGLRGKQKQTDVLTFLKETKASIVCFQDTHLTGKDLNSVREVWHECFLHSTRTNSRGVAILLNNNYEYKVHEMNRDTEGNYIQLLLACGSFKMNLINLYAPNTDSPKFFQEIHRLIANEKADHVVICGDFNLVFDPCKDSQGYININHPKARSKLLNIDERELVDIFRVHHPHTIIYMEKEKSGQASMAGLFSNIFYNGRYYK